MAGELTLFIIFPYLLPDWLKIKIQLCCGGCYLGRFNTLQLAFLWDVLSGENEFVIFNYKPMKSKKKKVAFPRRTWQINPVTRVKSSAKKYSRPRVKQDLQKSDE
jgi:hypothetical protein